LVIGIYAMKTSNTPGIGNVLSKYNFESIPEAHCYLEYQGYRIDLARYGLGSEAQINGFFVEKKISHTEIGEFKERFHKNYIRQQYGESGLKRIWRVREQCISAISSQ
jgi:hypothetical protein